MTSRRLLVVEDDGALGRALARLLRSYGYDVFVAASCEDARGATGRFSLGIIDVELPDGDGVDLAGELLSRGDVKRIVFFTSSTDDTLQQRTAPLGLVVGKSRGVAVLLIAVESMLEEIGEQAVGAEGRGLIPTSSIPPPSAVKKRQP